MANATYCFCGILYPDAENYNCEDVLATIRSYFDRWAYVLHDKDVLPDTGEQKKPHYHWVGKFDNARKLETVVNRLDIPAQYVEIVKRSGNRQNWKGAVRYLVHANDPDKFQYSVDDVVSNFDLLQFMGSLDRVGQMGLLIEFIDITPNCTWHLLYDFARKNGCYDSLISGRWLLKDIMYESRGNKV